MLLTRPNPAFSKFFVIALTVCMVDGWAQVCDETFEGDSKITTRAQRKTFNFNDSGELRAFQLFINNYEKPDGMKVILNNSTVLDELWFGKNGCTRTGVVQDPIAPPLGRSSGKCVQGPLVWANMANPKIGVARPGLFKVWTADLSFPFPIMLINEGEFEGKLTLPEHVCSATLEFYTSPGAGNDSSAWIARLGCPGGTTTIPKPVVASADACGDDGAIRLKAAPRDPSVNYHYDWSGPKGFRSNEQNPTVKNAARDNLGTYGVCISSSASNRCKSCDFVDVSALRPILSGKIQRPTACQPGAIDLQIEGGQPPFTYFWSNQGTAEDLKDIAPGEYSVEVEDSAGCSAETSFKLEPHQTKAAVNIPNAFSPDGDGLNEEFRIVPHDELEIRVETFQIYSRWGKLVYDNPTQASWNGNDRSGNPSPADGYVYQIVYTIDGCKEKYQKKGDVILVR